MGSIIGGFIIAALGMMWTLGTFTIIYALLAKQTMEDANKKDMVK